MNRLFEKIKERWEVENLWQVIVILVIFSVTGMSALYVKKFVFGLLGFTSATPYWVRFVTWIVTVLPSYQVLFLFYGFILGQFDFVWRFERNTFEKIKSFWSKE